ncbi:hypothetical protein CTKA_01987 [Chthonomonas calidirosea]|uniref:Putative alpha-amylase n=1 Tax=Chthonomonas calidirosea (strain DSM 23976 / ICMP 18418 / T49) TaxID=1303518 RepID=S0EVS6_CHTCT|nr:1,4-alpha-glucan branching protein domain-containing protein [Chthonomonas calidirosea]CCW35914.1 putative alpha-amylase [Chthonomonas calidirosea T49]CEK18872.1 hypothetical protein CTKA_01987 [Chthonomonas calidirosea]
MPKPRKQGYFALVLHSHIPYVLDHGRSPHGTDWLSEVTAETYLPLLDMLFRLVSEGISPKITLGFTPILVEQLADETFQRDFVGYLQQRIEAARENQRQFRYEGNTHMRGLAHFWEDYYQQKLEAFLDIYKGDLIGAFRRLQDEGHIEILTSAATHGYLPLLLTDNSVQAQIRLGVVSYKERFGRDPRGFWLPECAYRPRYAWNPPIEVYRSPRPQLRKGIEEFLAESDLRYFLVDAHLLRGGQTLGVYAERFKGLQELWAQFQREYNPERADRTPYAPYLVNSSGLPMQPVACFARDPKTGMQVWSGAHGYPGDEFYLEFHKKHYPGNLRYWRVSWPKDDLGAKQLYEPYLAMGRVHDHAKHFAQLVYQTVVSATTEGDQPPVVVAMYDTELFGHWWFEGPEFLYHALKQLHMHPHVEPITCDAYLEKYPPKTVVALPEGSWGEGGYHWIWLNEWTAWTWEKVYEAERLMIELAQTYGDVEQVQTILRQAARELLLLESSDWQFNISTFTSRDYAEQRVNYHYSRFLHLASLVQRVAAQESIPVDDWNLLGEAEERDRCFAQLNPKWWAAVEFPAAEREE